MLCRKCPWIFAIVVLISAVSIAQAQVKKTRTSLDVKAKGLKAFYIDSRAGNNQISIISESTLEDFICVCNKVSGVCHLDPQHLETFTDKFGIKVKDIKTGIALRDQHMQSQDWFDAKSYPEIVIKITKATDVKKIRPNAANITLVGTCSLHGKTNKVRIPCTLTYLDESPITMRRIKGDLIRIRGKFELKLSDYAVTGPKGSDTIGLKVANVLKVSISVFGSTERPPDPLKADTQPASAEPSKAARPKRAPPKRQKSK